MVTSARTFPIEHRGVAMVSKQTFAVGLRNCAIAIAICLAIVSAAIAAGIQRSSEAESTWLACGGRIFDWPVSIEVNGSAIVINKSFVWRPESRVVETKALIASGQYQPADVFTDAANSIAATAIEERKFDSPLLKEIQLRVNEQLARIGAPQVVLTFDNNGYWLVVEDPRTHARSNFVIEQALSVEEQQAAFRNDLIGRARYVQESMLSGVSIAWGNEYCERFQGEHSRMVRRILEAARDGALKVDRAHPAERFVKSDYSGEWLLNAIVMDIIAPNTK